MDSDEVHNSECDRTRMIFSPFRTWDDYFNLYYLQMRSFAFEEMVSEDSIEHDDPVITISTGIFPLNCSTPLIFCIPVIGSTLLFVQTVHTSCYGRRTMDLPYPSGYRNPPSSSQDRIDLVDSLTSLFWSHSSSISLSVLLLHLLWSRCSLHFPYSLVLSTLRESVHSRRVCTLNLPSISYLQRVLTSGVENEWRMEKYSLQSDWSLFTLNFRLTLSFHNDLSSVRTAKDHRNLRESGYSSSQSFTLSPARRLRLDELFSFSPGIFFPFPVTSRPFGQ